MKNILFLLLCLNLFSCNTKNTTNDPTNNTKTDPLIQETIKHESTFTNTYDFEEYNDCDCANNEREILDCDTTFLTNNAMLYWQINCDSVAYCFENNKKIVYLKSGSDYSLIERIDLVFIKEYDDYLFFVNELISGCCTPPDLVFLNKEDATEINRIPRAQFVYGNPEVDYVTYFQNENLTEFIFLNLKTNKKYKTIFDEGIIENAVQNNSHAIHINDVLTINENGDTINLALNVNPDSIRITTLLTIVCCFS